MKQFNKERCCGILLPIFSLPSPYGIGTLGKSAYDFIDKLHESGQSVWQILPLGHTGYGNSPYSTYSRIAGNPLFVDLDILKYDGLISESDFYGLDFGFDSTRVDYDKVWEAHNRLLRIAFSNSGHLRYEIDQFAKENEDWLSDYSLFMALKDHFHGLPVWEWPDEDIIRATDDAISKYSSLLSEDINYYNFIQYEFFKQWNNLRNYAHQKGVSIMGDLPIYPSLDSVDVWSEPYLYDVNDLICPINVAGAPPDPFSETGQLWGNPVYNWRRHKKLNYYRWTYWIKKLLSMYDILRIDHFRGFQNYWAVPSGDSTAKNGTWRPGPRKELFEALGEDLPLVAEDLGIITDDVKELLNTLGFPGMRVAVFADYYNNEHLYVPKNWPVNSVGYSSIHDSSTFFGEYYSSPERRQAIDRYFHSSDIGYLSKIYESPANTVITPFADLLLLGNETRINTPGTMGPHNWSYRMKSDDFRSDLANHLNMLAKTYNR